MVISGNIRFNKAIKLDSDRMHELESILLQFCERVEYACTIRDKVDIQFDTLSELLNYDNYGKRKIISLQISGYTLFTRIFRIDIENDLSFILNYSNTIRCKYELNSISKETLFTNLFYKFCDKIKLSYWLMGKMSLHFLLSLTGLIIVILSAVLTFGSNKLSTLSYSFYDYTLLFLIASLIYLGTYRLDKVILKKYFNPIVFCWGEEIAIFNKIESSRTRIFWGLFISPILGFIGGLILLILTIIYKI